jgi:RHS repeat-associated protein
MKDEQTQQTKNYTYNSMNQMTAAGNTTYTYDDNGNTLTETTGGQTVTYDYDYENHMASLDDGVTLTFTYDGDGIRRSKSDGTTTTKFVYDRVNVLLETDGNGTTTVRYTHTNNFYGGLICQKRGTTTSWYAFDGLGSTRQLTNNNESVTDTYSYDAFGNLLSSTGTTENVYRFVGRQGYYHDPESALTLLTTRYYQAAHGRFLTVDPIRSGLCWYLYGNANPINRTDPRGLRDDWDPPSPPTEPIITPPGDPWIHPDDDWKLDPAYCRSGVAGETECDPHSGEPVVHYNPACKTNCSFICAVLHETIHKRQIKNCCGWYKFCLEHATTEADKKVCKDKYEEWEAASEPRFECQAYKVSIDCLEKGLKTWNCPPRGWLHCRAWGRLLPTQRKCCLDYHEHLAANTKKWAEFNWKFGCSPLPARVPCPFIVLP